MIGAILRDVKISRLLVHIARYLVTAVVGWLVFPLQALGLYALAVVAAILLDGDPGSPFFLLFGLVVATQVGAVVMLAVILPAVIAGEVVARRLPWRGWRWVAAPIVAGVVTCVMAVGLSLAAVALWVGHGYFPFGTAAMMWVLCLVLSVLPFAAAVAVAYGLAVAPPLLRGAWRRLKACGAHSV